MKVRIQIKTPKGYARDTEAKLRPLIIGKTKRLTNETFANDDDNIIYWDVEGSVKDILRITKNVTRYAMIIESSFNNRMFKKVYLKKLSEEGKAELKDMLNNQTEVEIIKNATADEIIESDKTMWEKMKDKFQKLKE